MFFAGHFSLDELRNFPLETSWCLPPGRWWSLVVFREVDPHPVGPTRKMMEMTFKKLDAQAVEITVCIAPLGWCCWLGLLCCLGVCSDISPMVLEKKNRESENEGLTWFNHV